MAIGRYELTKTIAHSGKLTKKQAADMLDMTLCAIREALSGGNDVCLANFGSFKVCTSPEHQATNPNTREPVTVPAKQRIRFRPGKELTASVNKE
jgi:nucleoid DNA-binding protein